MSVTPDILSEPLLPRPKPSVAEAWILFFVGVLLICTLGVAAQLKSILPGLAFTELFLILLPAILFVRRKGLPIAESLGWRMVAPSLLVRSFLLGVAAWGVAIAIHLVWLRVIGLGPDPARHFWLAVRPTTFGELLACLVVIGVLPGICEESLFRGALLPVFERRGTVRAVIYTTLLFAVYHLSPWLFATVAVLGLLLGIVAVRTNSTTCAAACHTGANSTAVFVLYFLGEGENEKAEYILIAVLSVLFLAALVDFLGATRGTERRLSPLTAAVADVSTRKKLIVVGAAVGLCLLLVAGIVGLKAVVRGYHMATDNLAPEVMKGERVLVLKSRFVREDFKPGDVVAFRGDEATALRKVVRADADAIWITEKSSDGRPAEQKIPRDKVVGKMIYHFSFKGIRDK